MSRPILSAQRALTFETDRPGRNEVELRHALTKALGVLVGASDVESAVRESFVHAMAGLGADKGALVHVRAQHPLDIAILHSIGLAPENEAALVGLRPAPGINPVLIRRSIDDARANVVESSHRAGSEIGTPNERPYSVVCAPVVDSLSGGVVAVLYFQTAIDSAFTPDDVDWVAAYGAALGQPLTLHLSQQQRIHELQSERRGSPDDPQLEIIGDSVATQRLASTLNRLLPSTRRSDPPPILVTGESGTGKELVAHYLHRYSPARRGAPFITFNCAGLRGELAKAELFGHAKGSFTGAIADTPGLFRAAHKGVLFLDEVGEMPLEGQALLLRVLETRRVQPLGDPKEVPVDVQIVLATNRKLPEEVAAKRFREDLYYRVSALQVELMPLRDPSRIADIRPLLAFYVDRCERALKKKTMGLTPAAFRAFLHSAWPGNVRQLSNVCNSLVTFVEPGEPIDVADIECFQPDVLTGPKNPNPEAYLEDKTVPHQEAMDAFQNRLVLDRLEQCGGRAAAAAASLEISEPTFYRYLAQARKAGVEP